MSQTVLITGANGNMGYAIVKRLQDDNITIYGTTLTGGEAVDLEKEGVHASAVNLMSENTVADYIQGIDADIEAAILTVGGFAMGGFEETDGQTIHKMYRLNFETAYFIVCALLPKFEARGGGRFILIGSRPALNPVEGKNLVAYSLTKNMVIYLTELINAHGKGKNIDASLIVPSIIDTPPNRASMPDADFSKWVTVEAIADTVAFLLSDSGKQTRGSVIKLYNES